MNNLIYMGDNFNLCLIVSKICAFAPDWEKKHIRIWVDTSNEEFMCIYPTKEQLNCAIQNLESAIERTKQ